MENLAAIQADNSQSYSHRVGLSLSQTHKRKQTHKRTRTHLDGRQLKHAALV